MVMHNTIDSSELVVMNSDYRQRLSPTEGGVLEPAVMNFL
jgi:hypothetical protein